MKIQTENENEKNENETQAQNAEILRAVFMNFVQI